MWKWVGLFLRKNRLLRCWGWLSLLNWIWALTWSLLLKLPLRKLEPWFVLWSFFLLRLLCKPINLPYGHAWNTVVMSGLLLLIATWNCCISHKNDMLDCWSFFAASWTLGSSLKCSQLKSSTCITLVDVRLNWLNWFHIFILEGGLLVFLIDCMIFLSLFLNSFFPGLLNSGIFCL